MQYSDDIPKLEGENTPTRKKEPTAKTSTDNGGVPSAGAKPGSQGSKSPKEGSEEGDSSEQSGGAAAGGGDKGQGNRGGSANGAGKNSVQPGGQVNGAPASEKSDDGSSPLVPILVAILVLAAISFAVVTVRQRRQRGPTTPASEAS